MGMTSLEVVKSAIHFQSPDRLPMRFESLGINDTHSVGTNAIAPGDHVGRETYDEWHCLWRRTEMANMGQVKGNPLADWEAIETYRWPDPDDPAYYEGMEGRFAGAGTKYVMTGFFMLLFERMHTLRGMGNVLTELYTDPGRMAFLADRIVAFDLAVIRNIGERFPGRIHGFSFTDDWGTELATFISPRMWCDFFQPRYARLFEAAHAQGWDVWMHTCGRVNEIIEPLIEIGLDCINLQQPRALGIVEIGRRFAGSICFESGGDSPGGEAAAGALGHARGRLRPLRLWRRRRDRRAPVEEGGHAGGVPGVRQVGRVRGEGGHSEDVSSHTNSYGHVSAVGKFYQVICMHKGVKKRWTKGVKKRSISVSCRMTNCAVWSSGIGGS